MTDVQESYMKEPQLLFPLDAVPAGVGSVIARSRGERGWSKAQLSRKAKLSRWSIYRLEAGVRPQRADTLFRVARALDIPLQEIVPDWPEWVPIAGRTIGEVARARRRALGLTLAELAARIGVSEATLSRYERGVCASPRLLERVGDDYVPANAELAAALGSGAGTPGR